MVHRHVMARRAQSPRPVRPGGGARSTGFLDAGYFPRSAGLMTGHGVFCSCPGCKVKVLRTLDEHDPSGGLRR